MRPISHQILALLPVILAVVFVFVTATPVEGGVVSYTPNIAWLMTLLLAGNYRFLWPRGIAFGLGLLQDILFGTPLGSQALLTLLLAQWMMMQHARGQGPLLFRMRWLEATGTLVLLHALLWALLEVVTGAAPPLVSLLIAGAVNGLWYPLFYFLFGRETTA